MLYNLSVIDSNECLIIVANVRVILHYISTSCFDNMHACGKFVVIDHSLVWLPSIELTL